jgi:hypothetical protein
MARFSLVCALLLSLMACSGKSPTRVDVWGTVTFGGQPVPAGLVAINPDLSKGNDGPQGVAEIRNGHFDTRRLAKGAPSGAVILMIDGFDGASQPESPNGKPLFLGYKVSMDMPAAPTEKNIVVPDSAAAKGKTVVAPLP